MSLAFDKNLVKQKIPFFSSKSSFIWSTMFDKTERACPCNYLSCGADHLVTAYEELAESIYKSKYLIKCEALAKLITFSSLDSMAFSNPDHNNFFNYKSSAFVPKSTFRSADRDFD